MLSRVCTWPPSFWARISAIGSVSQPINVQWIDFNDPRYAELSVDMDKIQEISKHVLSLYDLWKTYDEKKEIAGILAKMPKPKTQPPQN